MKRRIGKRAIFIYGIVWITWLSWNPSRTVESDQIPKEPPLIRSESAEGFIPAGFSTDAEEPCRRCHDDPNTLKINIKDPSCLECHLPDDERIQADKDTVFQPMQVSEAPSSPGPAGAMIHIPNGVFLMGSQGRTPSEGSGNADEGPVHQVYVRGFLIDQTEVTNVQYKAFLEAVSRKRPRHWKENTFPEGKERHPVSYVSWFDANDYCHWVGKRLPTEAEWEKAARGTEALRFPWGNTFDPMKSNTPQRWLVLEKKGDTLPVGSLEGGKSPYGLYDMAGNVYEWTSSWYKPYPNNAEFNAHYGEKNKIVRGGSWYDCLSYGCGLSTPTFNRSRFAPVIRNKSFGFRCAKSDGS